MAREKWGWVNFLDMCNFLDFILSFFPKDAFRASILLLVQFSKLGDSSILPYFQKLMLLYKEKEKV